MYYSKDNADASSLFIDRTALWIWPSAFKDIPNHYVEFRHEFEIKDVSEFGNLYISVDSEYAVWINGEFIDCGQYHDYPDAKTCDVLDVARYLKPGKNVLCVLAYYQGDGSFQYIKGLPGLIYVLDMGSTCAVSGLETKYRKSPSYFNGPLPMITLQLGFTFEYDARGDDGWRIPDYVPNKEWNQISVTDTISADVRTVLQQRPINKLVIKDRLITEITAQGVFKRIGSDIKTVAEEMQSDYISPRITSEVFRDFNSVLLPQMKGVEISSSSFSDDGVYLVIDIGREDVGILDLDVESGAGCIIDIAWGEHLDDLRVRSYVGKRNFAVRYICCDGRQSFIHPFKRLGGRYIQLHISNAPDGFILYYAGIRSTEYPIDFKGSFNSSDNLQNKIYGTAVRTLHLCMHEHYEDCPWREQSLYANDSRNQAITGYYCFGDYNFPAASFKLLGDGLNKDDGYLEMCAPAHIPFTIPSFSMTWILAAADHFQFSNDVDVAQRAYGTVRSMLSAYMANMNENMLPCPQGPSYWHFYDWAEGLDGTGQNSTAFYYVLGGLRFDAPLNLFYLLALDAGGILANACGYPDEADAYEMAASRLRGTFHTRFWDDKEQAYLTYIGEGSSKHFSELSQALALYAKACPAKITEILKQRLASDTNGMVEVTLSQSFYKFEALLQDSKSYTSWVFEKILNDWGYMLTQGATSFWETLKGADDFDKAGSLCHGWSGIPAYFYQAYVLGIRPLDPGFKTFLVDPYVGELSQASGKVPTPYGNIDFRWENVNGEVLYHLSHPKETMPVFVSDIKFRCIS